jgi:hypothetical protein
MIVFRSRMAKSELKRLAGPVGMALFVGLTIVGVFTNSLQRRSVNTAKQVAAAKSLLPSDVELVSIDFTHHLFAYYYEDPIGLIKVSRTGKLSAPEATYFCFENRRVNPSRLNFKYETIAVVSCARFKDQEAVDIVTVARLIEDN